jgi:Xaa-Pro aminopeptidase
VTVPSDPTTQTQGAAPGSGLPELSPLSVAGRVELVREAMQSHGCDALVVTSLTNVRWLTGFTGSHGAVLVGPDEAVLATDSRYTTQAPGELERAGSPARVAIANDLVAGLAEGMAPGWVTALEDSIAWGTQRRWADERADRASGTPGPPTGDLVPVTELIEELRAVKTAPELERMQAAASVVDGALEAVAWMLRAGTSERGLALALDDAMRARGASGPAYETIVASGPNAALPHAQPTDRALGEGDLVIIDAGAVVDGYRSDMTRTFVIGEPSAQAREMLDVVTRSQAAGVAGVDPGVEAGAIDDLCREVIDAAGMGDAFIHGTGHGVGLDIHELPRVRKGSTAILRPGHVLTVEPGVYYPGVGGVRVEDTVVVTADGCRALTRFPKFPAAPR